GVDEQQGPRTDERGDRGPVPAVVVVEEHAVAVAVDAVLADVPGEVRHAAHGRGRLDAAVGRRDPECRGAAAGDAGRAEALRVDLGTGLQVVDRADRIPALDAGRRVAARMPPPALLAVGPVMDG